jgi:hypothetical protein
MLGKGWAYIVLALLVTCAGLAPWVQAGAQQQPSASIDTPIARVSAFVHPPPNFNPLTASDADLDQFGFPPRPSAEEGTEMMAHLGAAREDADAYRSTTRTNREVPWAGAIHQTD